MSGLLILGGGGHGKVVADAALAAGWMKVAFLDDRVRAMTAPLGLPILGTLAELVAHAGEFSTAIAAVGDARRRLQLLKQCRDSGYETASIVHPSASLSKFSSLSAGCVLFAQSAVNASTTLGEACIINTGATVDHDCVIADGVHICPGAHLAGNVRVNECAWVGIGAVVRQGVTIGRNAMIGAGAVVVADVADGAKVVGVPAKPQVDSR